MQILHERNRDVERLNSMVTNLRDQAISRDIVGGAQLMIARIASAAARVRNNGSIAEHAFFLPRATGASQPAAGIAGKRS